MRMLDDKDVVCLLRSEVERAGGQSAWARREDILFRVPQDGCGRIEIHPDQSVARYRLFAL